MAHSHGLTFSFTTEKRLSLFQPKDGKQKVLVFLDAEPETITTTGEKVWRIISSSRPLKCSWVRESKLLREQQSTLETAELTEGVLKVIATYLRTLNVEGDQRGQEHMETSSIEQPGSEPHESAGCSCVSRKRGQVEEHNEIEAKRRHIEHATLGDTAGTTTDAANHSHEAPCCFSACTLTASRSTVNEACQRAGNASPDLADNTGGAAVPETGSSNSLQVQQRSGAETPIEECSEGAATLSGTEAATAGPYSHQEQLAQATSSAPADVSTQSCQEAAASQSVVELTMSSDHMELPHSEALPPQKIWEWWLEDKEQDEAAPDLHDHMEMPQALPPQKIWEYWVEEEPEEVAPPKRMARSGNHPAA